jgi:3-oxo-4-pregnene-20-carboxyl-CoA dehydrogenase alpha subunit
VNGDLSDEAVQLGKVVHDLIEGAGGVQLLRRAVADPGTRAEAEALLGGIELWDLAPAGDPLELEMAAAACRAAGWFALPYPVVERLGRLGSGATGTATALVEPGPRAVAMHLDLELDWTAVDLLGRPVSLAPGPRELLGTELAPFGVETTALPGEGAADARGAAILSTLSSWWLLGLLEHATADTVRYTREREQFGRVLAKFQAVAFRLADMTLATRSLGELAKYTLWSIATDPEGRGALTDAVALRLAALDAADLVLRGAHQLHGAMGFTDEVDVSWLSRASQGVRRLPLGRDAVNAALTALVGTAGLADLGHPVGERVPSV